MDMDVLLAEIDKVLSSDTTDDFLALVKDVADHLENETACDYYFQTGDGVTSWWLQGYLPVVEERRRVLERLRMRVEAILNK